MEHLDIINTWQFNLVVWLIAIVGFNQFYKIAVKDSKSAGAATILLQIIATLVCFLFIPLFPVTFPSEWKYWALLVAASVFYALSNRIETTTRKALPVSEFSIISQLSKVFTFIYGLTLFQEPFALNRFIGMIFVIAANVVLSLKKGKVVINKYVWLTILSTLCFATAGSIGINISEQFNLPFYIGLTLLIPALMIMIAEQIRPSRILEELTKDNRKYYWITGTLWSLAIIFSLRSFQVGGEVTTITPIKGASVLLNVLVATLFLGEKEDLLKKIIATGLVMIGICVTVI